MADVVPISLPPLASSITVASRVHIENVAVKSGELPRHLLPAESIISPRKHYLYISPKDREEYDARQLKCRTNWISGRNGHPVDRMPPPIRDKDTDAKRARRQDASDMRAMLAVQAVEARTIAFMYAPQGSNARKHLDCA